MKIAESDILHASVLIVDDQEANVSLLEHMLEDAGYDRVASTMNPLEVCALHRKHGYDLILLDLQMPGMDGFQVIEGLKTNVTDGYLPVLVITAQPGHKLRALQAGARDFISKPFGQAEVARSIDRLVRLGRLPRREATKVVVLPVSGPVETIPAMLANATVEPAVHSVPELAA